MKKGLSIVYVILAVILSISVSALYNCTDGTSSTPCVCGHTPNSTLGYGQVLIGINTVSCDNIADGVCPEDFAEPDGDTASCRSCTDPDCTALVRGNVYDEYSKPIGGATITASPIRWNASANLEKSTTSVTAGNYSFYSPTGIYYFSASKEGYDTLLLELNVTWGLNTTANFVLQNGTCHDDCTNSYGRCNAACDGATFDGGVRSCNFFNSNVRTLCNNRLLGTEIRLGEPNATGYAQFVNCCEGIPYSKYYSTANTDNNNIKNLVKTEKIARYNDVPVRVVVAYWRK